MHKHVNDADSSVLQRPSKAELVNAKEKCYVPIRVIYVSSFFLFIGANVGFAADSDPSIVVRIPASVIADQLDQEIQHTAPVDQVILGTHSQGTATCNGTVSCQPEYSEKGIALTLCVRGCVESTTFGANGPARINSKGTTNYVLKKRVFFDGEKLVANPATISSKTRIQVTGISSTLPGLRGRLVKRVAQRKASESHSQAQSIVQERTRQELLTRGESELNIKLAEANEKLAKHLQVLHLLVNKDDLRLRSHAEFIEVSYGPPGTLDSKMLNQIATTQSGIEIWIKTEPLGGLQKITLAMAVNNASEWLSRWISPARNLYAWDWR